MDKILLVDLHNQIWRASTTFGQPQTHEKCSWIVDARYVECEHKLQNSPHCICGSPWHKDNFCYGQKYLIIFNFFRNLRPLIEQFSPDKCFMIMEGHPQFRYDLYSDYKANRIIKKASSADKQENFDFARNEIVRILKHFPITIARAAAYESDDTIATLVDNLKDEDITILSNDTDFIQLLQKGYANCQIYNPIKKEFMVAPDYFYLCHKILNGDKSDNIPGLLKPKKALETAKDPQLLSKFLESEENKANFNINKQLIEFRMVPEEEIILTEGIRNFDIVKKEFEQMEFQSIVNENSWRKYTNTFDCLKY